MKSVCRISSRARDMYEIVQIHLKHNYIIATIYAYVNCSFDNVQHCEKVTQNAMLAAL